jgi:NAD(P)-dependent dehydrogenase (short-subunit alcohol dehydrogenase family)
MRVRRGNLSRVLIMSLVPTAIDGRGQAMHSIDELFSLKGKTALVTGGATGLGRICAEALLGAGARVLIASRKADQCVTVSKELSGIGPCEGFGGNVNSEEGVADLVAKVRSRTDILDILVNNAGTTWGAEFDKFNWAAWERVLSVNVIGLFTLTRDLMPMLVASGSPECPSRVVNMGSITGTLPIGGNAYSYAASKAAVHHLTRVLSNEFVARNVNVNAIAPGPFETRMTAFALGNEETRRQAVQSIPMGRFGMPADLAGALLFLCSRGGAYTTGAIIPLDGGMSSDAVGSLWHE